MAALVALLAVVVGVPWALVAVGGNPLPTSLSGSLLTESLGADAILGVLIAVMWVAWAHFVVCLVIELRAHRRHRAGVTTAQGTSHPLVRRLVASIVLVASSAAVSATAVEAAQPVASHATFVSRVAADADALRQLADQAGVSNPYLSQIERGLRRPSADVLQQLAKALRISAKTLYVRAGILDSDESGDRDVQFAILCDPALTERQRQVLLDIYNSFRRENQTPSHLVT